MSSAVKKEKISEPGQNGGGKENCQTCLKSCSCPVARKGEESLSWGSQSTVVFGSRAGDDEGKVEGGL